jgi:hypothetical protein
MTTLWFHHVSPNFSLKISGVTMVTVVYGHIMSYPSDPFGSEVVKSAQARQWFAK